MLEYAALIMVGRVGIRSGVLLLLLLLGCSRVMMVIRHGGLEALSILVAGEVSSRQVSLAAVPGTLRHIMP
jgi:hypothetical protein